MPAGQDNPHECVCVPVSLEILRISFLAHFSSSAHPAHKIRGCGQSVFFYLLCLGRLLMHAGDTIHASGRATASGTVQGMALPGSCVSPDTSVRSTEYRVLADVLSVAVAVLPPHTHTHCSLSSLLCILFLGQFCVPLLSREAPALPHLNTCPFYSCLLPSFAI